MAFVIYKDKLSVGAILGQFHKRSNWRTQGTGGKVGKERFLKKQANKKTTEEKEKTASIQLKEMRK